MLSIKLRVFFLLGQCTAHSCVVLPLGYVDTRKGSCLVRKFHLLDDSRLYEICYSQHRGDNEHERFKERILQA